MKKLAAFILLLVYFTVSTGFVVSVHYCMNKRSSVELGYAAKNECGKCGMNVQKSGGCCKNDVKLVKMQVDQSFAKNLAPDFSIASTAVHFADDYFASPLTLQPTNHPLAHGPPVSKQDTYLRNRVFRV